MLPGQAPVRMDGLTFNETITELRRADCWWLGYSEFGNRIEPIEDEQ